LKTLSFGTIIYEYHPISFLIGVSEKKEIFLLIERCFFLTYFLIGDPEPNKNNVSGGSHPVRFEGDTYGKTTSGFLDWGSTDRVKRFDDIVDLFSSESIGTEDDLRGWVLNERNLLKLAMIKGIGPKTIDYFKILTGIQTCTIDRRLLDFLKQAGIEVSSYDEAKATINLTADTMGVQRAYLDHSIWEYIGKQGPQPCR